MARTRCHKKTEKPKIIIVGSCVGLGRLKVREALTNKKVVILEDDKISSNKRLSHSIAETLSKFDFDKIKPSRGKGFKLKPWETKPY